VWTLLREFRLVEATEIDDSARSSFAMLFNSSLSWSIHKSGGCPSRSWGLGFMFLLPFCGEPLYMLALQGKIVKMSWGCVRHLGLVYNLFVSPRFA